MRFLWRIWMEKERIMSLCNRCEEREAVVDWGICAQCFGEFCNRKAEEILSDEGDDES